MKTSETVEAQEERKAARNNRDHGDSLREVTQSVRQKHKRGDASYTARIAPWRWQPGKSANPGGVPKHDVSKEIAQAIFLNNAEMIYTAYCKMMRRGNAYAFQVLAERAWGKLREKVEVDVGPYRDVPIADLEQEVKRLEEKLGYRKAEEEAPPISGESKPN